MSPERWEQLKSFLTEKYEVVDHGVEELSDTPTGTMEFFEFDGPLGLMRVEWIQKPRVIDRKVTASKRIGSQVTEELVYSPDEKMYALAIYRFDAGANNWIKVALEDLLPHS